VKLSAPVYSRERAGATGWQPERERVLSLPAFPGSSGGRGDRAFRVLSKVDPRPASRVGFLSVPM
jgi:hypothetical protein